METRRRMDGRPTICWGVFPFMFVEHVSRVPCDFCGGNPDGHNSNMTARTNMEGDNSSLGSQTLDGSNRLTLSRLFAQS